MSKSRVIVGGYNLASEKGTRITAYARRLSAQLSVLAHQVDLTYGIPSGKKDVLAEVSFFDPVKPMKTHVSPDTHTGRYDEARAR